MVNWLFKSIIFSLGINSYLNIQIPNNNGLGLNSTTEAISSTSECPLGYYIVEEQKNYLNGTGGFIQSLDIPYIKECPFGYYCMRGVKIICPGGTFGNVLSLQNSNCSGICPEGWYCPPGSISPVANPCPCFENGVSCATTYCPEGSSRCFGTAQGFYAVRSHLNEGGGYGGQSVCPRGSYCNFGVVYPCPAGRYGSILQQWNSSCSGTCEVGYYCPPGSIDKRQNQCQSTDQYCPEGSGSPTTVSLGYYTEGADNSDYEMVMQAGGNGRIGLTRVSQTICPPGFFCLSDGIKRPCPRGRYGSTYGIYLSQCSGDCLEGYYCPEGSISSTQMQCGAVDLFCPPGSASPQMVQMGYYTVFGSNETTRTAEKKCEPGYYCFNGTKGLCSPGYYGDSFGLTVSTCTDQCSPGYYCPAGSIQSTEVMCGDDSRYCPSGSTRPTQVSQGYYSAGGNDSTRISQLIAPIGHYAVSGLLYTCAAGYYGASLGLNTATCSGSCSIPGYYCPTGSISPTMRYCGGDSVFCPGYTVAPISVNTGYYTADYLYESCPPGRWRNLTTVYSDFFGQPDSSIATQYPIPDCILCPEGTYKSIEGDDFSLCRPCGDLRHQVSTASRIVCDCVKILDPGLVSYFNISNGLRQVKTIDDYQLIDASFWDTGTSLTRSKEYPCEPGHYCIDGLRYRCPAGRYGSLKLETRPSCEGLCSPGFFCPSASTSPYTYPCSDAKYYCPAGSSVVTLVDPGYYTNEDIIEELRSYQTICPAGYYCPGDGKRYLCPPGTYADEEGTVSSQCKGLCTRGYYCLEGSTSAKQNACGGSSVYCPRGSGLPTPVTDGFYCDFSGADAGKQRFWDTQNTTCSIELPCEPGYFCVAGVKYACPPGTFGWRYGLNSSLCSGLCAPGFYCPSYLLPQPGAPTYTQWPGSPQISATTYECGSVTYYCPKGSGYPVLVSSGYYSIGGGRNNRTKSGETICPPGTYCNNAVSYLCPSGRYGSTAGLVISFCTAACPAGFYCASGTSNPIQCPPTEYSTGSAGICSVCPGGRTTPLQCQTNKNCCFRN